LKKLIIIRHAKSDWSNNTSDLDRPISMRGVNDAKIIYKIFDSQNLQPEIIYTSIAKRAIETSKIFIERSKFLSNLDCLEVDELYDFSGNGVKSFIKNLNEKLSTVLIFTHNNSCNFLVNDFANRFNLHVPTCGMLIFEFNVSLWAEIEKSDSFSFFFPKQYR
tara:strand:- start:1352 stop:1840 length:489 start_codon:yes stop_codon:yes gene_type:complete